MLWYKIAGFVATESAEKYPDIIFKISGFHANMSIKIHGCWLENVLASD